MGLQSSWEDQPERKPDVSHLSRLWRFVYPYRWGFALTFAILTVSFGLEVLRPLLVRLAINGPVTDAVGGGAPETSPASRDPGPKHVERHGRP